VDLDGTHRAIVETDAVEFLTEAGALGQGQRFCLAAHGGRECGCILAEVRRAPENRIHLDRFKMARLGIKDGDEVEVRLAEIPQAKRLLLSVPKDFTERDVVRFIGKPLARGEQTALFTFSGEARGFTVAETEPAGVVFPGSGTEVRTVAARDEGSIVTYAEIGGLGREIKKIREVVEYPFRSPELFRHLGVQPPKGIILHGPPGTGKTLIARALANEVGAHVSVISGPEVYSKWYGKTEQTLRNVFEDAVKNAPSIVVIDELDALVPRREKAHGDQEQRIVATFLTQMDGLKEMRDVVVLGTTNRIDAIDPALRRGGRFECEVHIGVPDVAGRQEILRIHTRGMPIGPDVRLDLLAERSVGFVGADVASLCREAAYAALRRTFPEGALAGGRIAPNGDLAVTQADFDAALAAIPPSGMKELAVEIPKVGWGDVGGLDEVKRLLVENIVYGVTRREAFRRMGIVPARGVLLHGPPGTGKTLLARAVAHECGANFVAVRGPELRSRWLGEAEERIRFLFAKARLMAPCVVFFDEIDAAIPARGRDASGVGDAIVNQILSEMDGIEGSAGVFVIGATNRLELLDPAVLRPGRFDHLVRVPLPDAAARRAIFAVHLRGKPLADDVDAAELALATDGFSGADVAEVCRLAAWRALSAAGFEAEGLRLAMADLAAAVEETRAAIAGRGG
jgi:transitional endoplasmic reticulum ATPase